MRVLLVVVTLAATLAMACQSPLPASVPAGIRAGLQPDYAGVPARAVSAAQKGLVGMLSAIPIGFEQKYGFGSRSEFERAGIGKPYRVWIAAPDGLKRRDLADLDRVIRRDVYRFPVVVDGEYRALLTVALDGDTWKSVEIGAAELAREMAMFESTGRVARGGSRVLLRIPSIKVDFLGAGPDDSGVTFSPLLPAESAMPWTKTSGAVPLYRVLDGVPTGTPAEVLP